MQAKRKIGRFLIVALIVSLTLVACGGRSTGKTWFNLPSVRLDIQEDASATLYGFTVPNFKLDPALITTLQSADIQRLEVRIGYNGVHIYLNGEDMPYLEWDEEKADNLAEIVRVLPPEMTMGYSDLIANNIPLLRRIGLGVRLDLPVGAGNTAKSNIAKWTGETEIDEQTVETTIGPIVVASLVFDESGEAIIEGLSTSELSDMLGRDVALSIPPATLALLQSMDMQTLRIETHANGIRLSMNEKPLPGIAYDSARLETTATYASAFTAGTTMEALLPQLLPLLQGTDLTVVVSFTGEPVATTEIGTISLVVTEDGSLSMDNGLQLAAAVLPVDIVGKLQDANVQELGINLLDDVLAITANGKVLPTISFDEASLESLAGLVAPMANIEPSLITEGLGIVKSLGADVKLQLPAAEGAEAVEIVEEPDFAMKTPDIGRINKPIIQLSATYGDDGFSEIGGFSSDLLNSIGVSMPTLPPDLINTLTEQGISNLGIKTGDGALNVVLDDSNALTVNYDTESLKTALELAAPFMGEDSPLNNPVIGQFIQDQILPIIPAADVDVSLELE